MYCNTSIKMHIVRGLLAVACIAGAIMLTPQFWPTVVLFAVAIVLMGGCPTCWLVGLIEAVKNKH